MNHLVCLRLVLQLGLEPQDRGSEQNFFNVEKFVFTFSKNTRVSLRVFELQQNWLSIIILRLLHCCNPCSPR